MNIVEEKTDYHYQDKNYDAYFYYDADIKGKRPGVIVLPEWWGLNDYSRSRAKQLAELGYASIAIDVYGDGKQGNTPTEAQALANTYYTNLSLSKPVMDAAIEHFKTFSQVDDSKVAAIGYCFGGAFVLNAAKLGADLKGIVSIHGGLKGVAPNKDLLKAKLLVCHGAADVFENDNVAGFHQEMDDAGIDYTFKEYPGAQHAFSNPIATEVGEKYNMPISYNAEADKNSWNDMKGFLDTLFKN
ncbi:MAG: dienelactone hydrolase family protein [Ginsengibacter sp.]|jgi:dienelactone hydrolase